MAAAIKAPVGAAPVLVLTGTSRGESQRESKVSPLTQSGRPIYASSQFPSAKVNQDVVKVAVQLFCHRQGGRGAVQSWEKNLVGCFSFWFWAFYALII